MYVWFPSARKTLRSGATVLAVLFTCSTVMASAAGLTAADSGKTAARMLVPVGHTVGIKLFSRGVMVVKLSPGGTPAKACGLQTGDVIVKCGGDSITSSEHFQSLLQENGENTMELQVRRSGSSMTLSVEPEQNEQGVYCIGAWIRDSMAGIGTMTYYDPQTGAFGALGHGITDVDTACLMPFGNGAILPSTVRAVNKGIAGEAGELRGRFDLLHELGTLHANTDCGIFGTMTAKDCAYVQAEAIPVGTAQDHRAVKSAGLQRKQGMLIG